MSGGKGSFGFQPNAAGIAAYEKREKAKQNAEKRRLEVLGNAKAPKLPGNSMNSELGGFPGFFTPTPSAGGRRKNKRSRTTKKRTMNKRKKTVRRR